MRDSMQFDDAICEYAICAWDAGEEAISESHKCVDLSPAVGVGICCCTPHSGVECTPHMGVVATPHGGKWGYK